MTRRAGYRLVALFALVLIGSLANVGGASAAVQAAPHWKFRVETNSALQPGGVTEPPPHYWLVAKNIGAAPTQGNYTITDVLPAGLELSTWESGLRGSSTLVCATTGTTQITVTCSGNEPIAPGKALFVDIPVIVPATQSGTAVNQARAEGGGAEAEISTLSTPYSDALPNFEFRPGAEGVFSTAASPDGQDVTEAGTQPTQEIVSLAFPWKRAAKGDLIRLADDGDKNLEINLPKGVVVNPQATPVKCTEVQLHASKCPNASQVGQMTITASVFGGPGEFHPALYNMVAPPGVPAVFAFEVLEGVYVHIIGKVRSEGDYGLTADINYIPAKIGFLGAEAELWGVPTSALHDPNRGPCAEERPGSCTLEPGERNGKSFLTTPSSCGSPLITTATALSYGGTFAEGESAGAAMSGCNQLAFAPTIRAQATTPNGESPSGLEFNLHLPQSAAIPGTEAAEQPRSAANLKDVTVTLPEGMVLNPSSANGLGACGAAQIGLKTPVGQSTEIHFDESRGGCPDASKIGTVSVSTPLLEEPLTGSVYLAKPFENPFGSLLAIYVAVEDAKSGVIAKLPGKVDPDPSTGRLTATFVESPELPIEDIDLELFKGEGAVLTTPVSCGGHTTNSVLTPWTTPEGADATPEDSFQTTTGCSADEASAPKDVSFSAGTQTPLSGAYSPFSLRLVRADGTQHITGIDTTLPEGLLAKLAGVPYCPESGIDLAHSREAVERGREELGSPSCPSASEVGTVEVAAGSGISPYHVSGHAYLAGPYKGAPLSLVVIVPAVAGPFDLGDVVDRVALQVGEFSTQIHAVADPLPTIRDGIPLDVRSIELKISHAGFTRNPTSCEAMAIEGTVTTQAGQTTPLKNGFQVGECDRLGFAPKLQLSLKGSTKKAGHPALKAVVTMPPDGANIRSAQVSLPHSEFLDQGNLNKICSQADLKAASCPATTIYGSVTAWTPLLEKPLTGNVYLAGGFGYKLPALVAELNGQIRVLLKAKVDSDKAHGIRNTFEAVPDAAVERFVLEMKGGKKYGLLENSENLCSRSQKAGVLFGAQNGKIAKGTVAIANSCKKGKIRHKKRKHKHKKGAKKKHKRGAKKKHKRGAKKGK
jgi:hypothetical protein